MNNYLVNFAVYTFAMIGFIVMALFVYKKSLYTPSSNKNKDFLKVENSLKLSPAKTVYVIKAGNEKFLIAGDAANTTMLAKLESNNEIPVEESKPEKIMDFSTLKESIQRISRG